MLKNRTKLIFIQTPGAMTALKKCERNGDDFFSQLKLVMKVSKLM